VILLGCIVFAAGQALLVWSAVFGKGATAAARRRRSWQVTAGSILLVASSIMFALGGNTL
jgi:hypothetical protein